MTRRHQALCALLIATTLVTTSACEPGTGGRRITFELSIEPVPSPSGFRTALGWDVTLDEACASIGPIYLHAGPGGLAAMRRAYDWLVPSAHAHPGVDHFDGGEVRGEWLEQIAVDLASTGRIDLGTREGIAGEARSVTLGIHPPQPGALGAPECLRGHQAYVVGVAARDGTAVRFEGGLDIEEVGTKRRLQVSAAIVLDERRRVLVRVDPRPWLEHVKFEELALAPGTNRAQIVPGSQASVAWELGIQTADAFAVENVP